MNKYVKIGLIILAVVLVFVLAFAVDSNNTTTNTSSEETELSEDAETIIAKSQEESAAVKESEKKEFAQIDVNTYLSYLNGSEAQIILLARPTCGYCQIAEPIIQNAAYEYNIDINYLNTDNFQAEDTQNFINSNEIFQEGFGTPFLFIVKDGGIIDMIDGLTDKAHYIEFFKKNGYIS